MKVSHESPLILLEESRSYNDYDYALVHLFETNQTYYNFFKESLSMGREVVLDNSIFELGKAFNMEEFLYWVNLLQPTYYIVPDVLDDGAGTIANLHKWVEDYKPRLNYDGKMMCVVQGESYDEALKCYEEELKYADRLALSFNCKYYLDYSADKNSKEVLWMMGRLSTLFRMDREGWLDHTKEHHLLGVALPQEVQFYKHLDCITSVDTSNPVVHGLYGVKYKKWGLYDKKETKLVDLLETPNLTKEQTDCIYYNINLFKQFAN